MMENAVGHEGCRVGHEGQCSRVWRRAWGMKDNVVGHGVEGGA